MSLVVVGLSHKSAPVELRERVAFAEPALDAAVKRASSCGDGEALLVSTCNRVELYITGAPDDVRARVLTFLAEVGTVGESALAPHLYTSADEAATRHLFRVAASLDSMVVGEPQILGQVKAAYAAARAAGTVGATLERTVQRAFAVAKRVRTETAIARSSASVASAAVALARHIFGELDGKELCILGAGKMADLAATHLVAAGCKSIVVVNRTLARAEALAKKTGGVARSFEELESALGRADIVVCSTGAVRPVVSKELVQRVMKARRGRWLCFIDIAVPRDVEQTVGELPNVYLYDVDELSNLVEGNLADRQREAEKAGGIVEEELVRFVRDEKSLGLVPTIRALRERTLALARAEAERAAARLPGVAPDALAAFAEALVNKLLHAPLTALKRDPDHTALQQAARELFGLSEEDSHSASDAAPQHKGKK